MDKPIKQLTPFLVRYGVRTFGPDTDLIMNIEHIVQPDRLRELSSMILRSLVCALIVVITPYTW